MSESSHTGFADIDAIVETLRASTGAMTVPIVTEVSRTRRNPFEILISTLLSLRTKDETTRVASERLLARASTPETLLGLDEEEIASLIFPVGFYKTKARRIKEVCGELLERYGGQVPDELDELLTLKGVGRKTANLVVTLGFNKEGVCVDTHVHRISNRLGLVETKTPDRTEAALREALPRKYWIEFNDLLVTWGQNVCRPQSPFCSKCPIAQFCRKVGVTRIR